MLGQTQISIITAGLSNVAGHCGLFGRKEGRGTLFLTGVEKTD
jgi:hypothetical protein